MILNRNPGPGEYGKEEDDEITKTSPKWGFATAPRLDENKLLKAGDYPGPGAYDTYQKRPYEGHKIGIGMGFGDARGNDKKMKAAMKDPGPGAYNPALTTGAPSYSMGNRPSAEKGRKDALSKTDNPGPARYFPTNPNDWVARLHKGPKENIESRWSMAEKSAPLNSDKLNTPAPNAY